MILYGVWGPSSGKLFQCQILSWYVKEISTGWGTIRDHEISRGRRICHLQYFSEKKNRYHSSRIVDVNLMTSHNDFISDNFFTNSFPPRKCTCFVKHFTYICCSGIMLKWLRGMTILTTFTFTPLLKGRGWEKHQSLTLLLDQQSQLANSIHRLTKWYSCAFSCRVFLPILLHLCKNGGILLIFSKWQFFVFNLRSEVIPKLFLLH